MYLRCAGMGDFTVSCWFKGSRRALPPPNASLAKPAISKPTAAARRPPARFRPGFPAQCLLERAPPFSLLACARVRPCFPVRARACP